MAKSNKKASKVKTQEEALMAEELNTKQEVSDSSETKVVGTKKVTKAETKAGENKKGKDSKKKAKKSEPKQNKVKETVAELKKVTWPTFPKVVKNTLLVLGIVVIFTVVLFAIDFGLGQLFKLLNPPTA